MHLRELEYKHENELKNNSERYEYLRTIHNVVVDLLFDEHVLSIAVSDEMSSGAYIASHDGYFCFKTFFDDYGDTCHLLYHMPKANRRCEELLHERREKIEKRRKEIQLVK